MRLRGLHTAVARDEGASRKRHSNLPWYKPLIRGKKSATDAPQVCHFVRKQGREARYDALGAHQDVPCPRDKSAVGAAMGNTDKQEQEHKDRAPGTTGFKLTNAKLSALSAKISLAWMVCGPKLWSCEEFGKRLEHAKVLTQVGHLRAGKVC